MQYKLYLLLETLLKLLYTVSEVKNMRERSQNFDPRQVMQRDTFEIFHYRDPRPGFVEVHHHDFYEVYFLLEGDVAYWVEGRIIRLKPGDLLFINPMELHRPIADADKPVCERFVLWINREYLESMSTPQVRLNSCFDTALPNHSHLIRPASPERAVLTARMGELVRESYGKDFGGELSAQGIFLQLMVQLNRLARKGHRRQEGEELSPLVERAMHHIGENLNAELSLEHIAGELFVSKYHLSHAFSREVGVSVYRYIMLRRLMLARQLLLSGETAGQVCRSCGFSDYTSFYRAFKSEYGISPRELTASSSQP